MLKHAMGMKRCVCSITRMANRKRHLSACWTILFMLATFTAPSKNIVSDLAGSYSVRVLLVYAEGILRS